VVFTWTQMTDRGNGMRRMVTERRPCLSAVELLRMKDKINEFKDGTLVEVIVTSLNPDFIYLGMPNYHRDENDPTRSRELHTTQAYSTQKKRVEDGNGIYYWDADEDYDIDDSEAFIDPIGTVEKNEQLGITIVVPYGSYIWTDIRD